MLKSFDQELRQREAELEAREQAVAAKERALDARSIKHNLYDRLTISLRTVDAIIIGCVVAIAALVALGMYFGRG